MVKPQDIRISGYSYELPPERIAKYPLPARDSSKLLLYKGRDISTTNFRDLPALLEKDDLLVFNETKVVHARLRFRRKTGAAIEIFCLEPIEPAGHPEAFSAEATVTWRCLVGNAKKWKEHMLEKSCDTGMQPITLAAEIAAREASSFLIKFSWQPEALSFSEVLERFGETPIPPYLEREAVPGDEVTYQTVYSKHEGSVAAPTAGLHFTQQVLEDLHAQNIKQVKLSLHVGAGTFVPVKAVNAVDHSMHTEHFQVEIESLEQLLAHTGRIVAVGTTSCRSLESLYWLGVRLIGQSKASPSLHLSQWDAYDMGGKTDVHEAFTAVLHYMRVNGLRVFRATTALMIVPGYRFRVVNGLITNFHQPSSTLLMLIAAFIGDDWKKVYGYALKNGYRFLSYGDSSLLLP
jgi:S-adenosylmethionine:tRNA ribosyltransferase-isomerase